MVILSYQKERLIVNFHSNPIPRSNGFLLNEHKKTES